jgi:FkbM family methyltransferase
MKKIIKHIYYNLRKQLVPSFGLGSKHSFSQQGEDMVMDCLFQWNRTGFYVDVGAHHPTRYSNTYYFYKKGWKGINIDPIPGIMNEFQRIRPEDINLEIGIANKEGRLTYYQYEDSALNTFCKKSAEDYVLEKRGVLKGTLEIPVCKLSSVLEKYLPDHTTIDFFSIDVEGLDIEVLSSNDWSRFRPRAIIAEDLKSFTFEQVIKSDLSAYLKSVGYVPISKMVHSTVYCDESKVNGGSEILIEW